MINKNLKPKLLTGFGERNFGKQYRQGNRIYDSREIAMTLTAQPVCNMGGNSYLYIVAMRGRESDDGETHQRLEPRYDNITNAITTVTKDNLLLYKIGAK